MDSLCVGCHDQLGFKFIIVNDIGYSNSYCLKCVKNSLSLNLDYKYSTYRTCAIDIVDGELITTQRLKKDTSDDALSDIPSDVSDGTPVNASVNASVNAPVDASVNASEETDIYKTPINNINEIPSTDGAINYNKCNIEAINYITVIKNDENDNTINELIQKLETKKNIRTFVDKKYSPFDEEELKDTLYSKPM